MQAPSDGPNPLRPYYIPPSIGISPDSLPSAANATKPTAQTSSSFSFPDFDYSDYLSDASPSVVGSTKKLLDQALWKYTSVLMAQPFEVAKTILQVHVAQDDEIPREPSRAGPAYGQDYEEAYANSSDDEPNYFTPNTPFTQSSSRSPARGRRGQPAKINGLKASRSPANRVSSSPDRLQLKNTHSLLDALSSLSSNSGALAMWRATNSTFVHSILLRTFETFFRSLLAAVFGISESDILIPELSGAVPSAAILSSASPMATVLIATAASAISSLLLAPIDAARTRIILTPSSQEPRSLLGTLRTLSPSYLIPTHLVSITCLTSTLPALISSSSPFLFRNYLRLDPALTPTSWSIATFASSAVDLAVKFPLETVLRRAQISTWTTPTDSLSTSSRRKAIRTIVPVPQTYHGVLPTLWGIVREEGYSESNKDKLAAAAGKAPRRKRKGQGVEGLYRGWRVGLWGLVGLWGAGFIGGLQPGETAAETTGTHGGKF